MKTFEELARIKVYDAIRDGTQAQRVQRELKAGAGERRIHLPHFRAVVQAILKNVPGLGLRELAEPDARPPEAAGLLEQGG